MWDLPEPGLEPVSPALAGGLLTTAPPGRSFDWSLVSLYFAEDSAKPWPDCEPQKL